MDEIIVAKKAKLLAAYIVFIVFGVALAAMGIVFWIRRNEILFLVFFGVLGLIFIAFAIWMIIKYKKTPAVFITYKDGLFTFADGTTCNPNEITHVLVKITRQNGIENSTGGLVITINGSRKIEYSNVAQVKQAQNEIQTITDEYNAKLYRESMVAQPVAPAAPADPFDNSDSNTKTED